MKAHRQYTLEAFDPEWKERFTEAAQHLRPIFAENLVEIDHVGSTSVDVPDMCAKPQIDVLVVVKNLDAVRNVHAQMQDAGYTPHGRGYVTEDDEYFSKDAPDGSRLISVHTLEAGNPKIHDYKAFRDYLKVNSTDRELYVTTKKELYSQHGTSYAEYDSGKGEVIKKIKDRARVWASVNKH